jgi:4-aminobutyrate aminotransferase/(S)-3-amino-2-methylpropionate transaminase
MSMDDLPGRAKNIESIMIPRLTELAEQFPQIGDVRGRGAMLAVELVRPGTIEPDAARTASVAKACHAAGLLVLTCGTYSNVLRFLPPLVISDDELNRGLEILAGSLRANVPG